MATPRKYPTLAEFEDLKQAVSRIEDRLNEKPAKASVVVDAAEVCERIGIADAYGVPVSIGDEIGRLDGEETREVCEIAIRKASGNGKATLHAIFADGQSVIAVDMKLLSHVITKKATA